MTKFAAPLVGANYRRPAPDVINLLPAGAKLVLQREPENPFDGNAIKVLLYGCCPDGAHEAIYNMLAPELPEGSTNRENLEAEPMHIGYVKATEAAHIAPTMDECGLTQLDATLGFDIQGRPTVNSTEA